MQRLLEVSNTIVYPEITMKNSSDLSGTILVMELTNDLLVVQNISDSISRSFRMFHERDFIPSEIVKMIPDGICSTFMISTLNDNAFV